MSDHPKGNYWFASHWQEDDDQPHPKGYPWRVYIQLPGYVDHLDIWYPTQEAAEAFIRDDILGAGADLEVSRVSVLTKDDTHG